MATAAKIPVIDISDDANQAQVAKDLVEAAIEHGFIYIKNTGKDIPVESVENAFNIARILFKAPLEDKQRCAIQPNNRGWSGMHVETLDPKNQRTGDYKEAFNFGQFVMGIPQQPLPSAIQPYLDQISDFQDYLYNMCLKINLLLGIGLDVNPPTYFQTAHLRENGPSGTILRLLYYPPLSSTDASPTTDVRAGAHSDYGSMTMLFRLRGQAGLEVQTRDNTWAPVSVCPPGTEDDPAPPVLVNIGDLLSYWTNGLLRSTVHRVVFPGPGAGAVVEGESAGEPRYSIAFFCHPVGTTRLEAVPSERVRTYVPDSAAGEEEEGKNPYAERQVVTADEHLQMRLRASYLQLYDHKEEEEE